MFRIRAGARYDWRVEGMSRPPDLERPVRESLFEEEALEEGRRRCCARSTSTATCAPACGRGSSPRTATRTLVFTAEPGTRYEPVEVTFPGAHALSAKDLLKEAGGAGRIVSEPGARPRARSRTPIAARST